jgi:hypothetical protein
MNQEISDLFSQYDIGKTTQANFLKEIFDARDKWWIEQITRWLILNQSISSVDDENRTDFGKVLFVYKADAMNKWLQSLKQSLEAK